MIVFEKTAKVSSKGQITLPKRVRSVLKSKVVRIVVEDETVRLEPVANLEASLSQYAEGFIEPDKARDMAWSKVTHERHLRH